MGLTALGLIAARDIAPGHAGRWVGILTSAFGVGQIVGPPVAGFGFDLTGSFFLPVHAGGCGVVRERIPGVGDFPPAPGLTLARHSANVRETQRSR